MGSNPTLSAIESPAAETFPMYSKFDRENPAIPRGFAKFGSVKRTGDGGFGVRMTPRNAFFSTAKFDGSLSLSIRPGEEPVATVMKSHQTHEVFGVLDHRVHIRVEWAALCAKTRPIVYAALRW